MNVCRYPMVQGQYMQLDLVERQQRSWKKCSMKMYAYSKHLMYMTPSVLVFSKARHEVLVFVLFGGFRAACVESLTV